MCAKFRIFGRLFHLEHAAKIRINFNHKSKMANFSTLKEKILSFLTQVGIRKSDFFEATGIQSSNFKGANIKSAPGGDMLVRILTTYPDLSAEWLMRGEGSMLKSRQNIIPSDLIETDPQSGNNYIPPTTPINITSKDKNKNENLPPSALTELVGTIRNQAEEIGRLKARIEELERNARVHASPQYAHTSETVPT